jgi:hypothetical protein
MPTLVSPGVSVSVTDESMYAPAGQGTVPLVVVATAENKTDPSTSNIAIGTTSANAGKPYLVTSQRELVTTFGEPKFQSLAGVQLNGDERNEYGLLSTYSYLGISNRAYVVRANVNLAELEGTSSAPKLAPANGTYWLDTTNTDWGIFTANATHWNKLTPTVLTDTPGAGGSRVKDTSDNDPVTEYGQDNDYVLVASTTPAKLWQKVSGTWEVVGSPSWKSATGANVYIQPGTGSAPTTAVSGSYSDVWLKTTPGGQGANIAVKSYNTSTSTWNSLSANLYSRDDAATATEGSTLAQNDVYVQFDDFDDGNIAAAVEANFVSSATTLKTTAFGKTSIEQYHNTATKTPEVMYTLKIRGAGTESSITGTAMDLVGPGNNIPGVNLTAPATGINFELNGQDVNVTAAAGAGAHVTLAEIVSAINGLQSNTGNVVASIDYRSATDQRLRLARAGGYEIYLQDGTAAGTISAAAIDTDLKFVDNVSTGATAYKHFSLWSDASYEASSSAPTSNPVDGTLWYKSTQDADIYIAENDGGTMKWKAYVNSRDVAPTGSTASGGLRDLQIVSGEPTKQSDGTALANGDIWIDSDELDSYPKIYKYNSGTSKWVLLDNTDQSTADGVIFADAVGNPGGADQDAQGWGSNYSAFHSDAPDPATAPAGIILFNTRLSGYNVKKYTINYTWNNTNNGNVWVSTSGLRTDGSPYMGRSAQRNTIVTSMQSALASNEEIRAESRFFNIIAAPGYPELLDEMITLSTDRKQTAFVLADTPFRLKPSGTSVQAWATNSNNAATNGEDGLTSSSAYAAVYYPSGFSTDLSGSNVVVPASHIALRTLAFNDQVAYPWFAPAGFTRGLVGNSTSVGYITSEGEFQAVTLSEGQRDTMYANKVNPIAFIPNRGLVVFGQKTLSPTATAMDRINVARLIVYLRYHLDLIAKPFLFEPNDRITRDQVTDTFNRFLEDLTSKRALFDFLVVCDETNNTGTRIDKNELWIDIAIQPVKAVEFIYIPLRIKNTGESLTS